MRELDLILYGATGFVGRLVAEHLAEATPPGLRVGLAGRSLDRLERVRAALGPAASEWLLVLADSGDEPSLRSMAERSRVVASTVGPYLRYGLPLVEACAAAGTDYADLTGEVLFVREAIERCHDAARGSGARLVVSCGFDSVPSDLSVHVLHALAADRGAGGLTDTTLRARELSGGISGGTVDSLRAQLELAGRDRHLRRILADPAALTGGVAVRAAADARRQFRDGETGEWAAPFVMASYKTRLVLRSHALRGRGYGDRFRYREIVPTGRGVGGRLRATGLAAGVA
ncbi:trans-acting enoyl reductase family protein, partial [Agrococcus sp. HG114]|uniref:saccharopine dehydrogenase family protein n=1 Tax=Agrococcus sp. HG114 TaxID=2969757 RepID=UPI00215B467D